MKYLDDTPPIISSMKYMPSGMWFEVVFFNGGNKLFSTDDVCDNIDILASNPSRMQWLQAENTINKLAEKHWKKWFPVTIGDKSE